MAETILVRPSNLLFDKNGSVSSLANIWDGNLNTSCKFNDTTYIHASGGSYVSFYIFNGFDCSGIPENATITEISAIVNGLDISQTTGATIGEVSVSCVRGNTGEDSDCEDCGDNRKTITNQSNSISTFPNAATYWSNNLENLRNGDFQLRVYINHICNVGAFKTYRPYVYISEMYVNITYKLDDGSGSPKVYRGASQTTDNYIGTQKAKAIYIGTQKAKAIYVGTTKMYG